MKSVAWPEALAHMEKGGSAFINGLEYRVWLGELQFGVGMGRFASSRLHPIYCAAREWQIWRIGA